MTSCGPGKNSVPKRKRDTIHHAGDHIVSQFLCSVVAPPIYSVWSKPRKMQLNFSSFRPPQFVPRNYRFAYPPLVRPRHSHPPHERSPSCFPPLQTPLLALYPLIRNSTLPRQPPCLFHGFGEPRADTVPLSLRLLDFQACSGDNRRLS